VASGVVLVDVGVGVGATSRSGEAFEEDHGESGTKWAAGNG
jgi:hypothetical protein